jgi:hypothetical protein
VTGTQVHLEHFAPMGRGTDDGLRRSAARLRRGPWFDRLELEKKSLAVD